MTWVMWNLVLVYWETMLVSGKIGARFTPNVPSAQHSFWTYPMVLLGDEAKMEAHFGPFGDSVSVGAR